MYPNTQNDTIDIYQQGLKQGFVVGIIACAGTWAVYKLNKSTIKNKLRRMVGADT